MRFFFITISCFLILITNNKCATRGTPSGGEKDSIPPIMIRSIPKENSVFFDKEKIILNFNEYIKLKDLSNQLVISPPLNKSNYEIKPKLSASKKVEIKFLKPLIENTTYTFNFGKSINDFNEGNLLPFFSYAFSTGADLDSLSFNGIVKDAIEKNPEELISIHLYPIDSTYNDSTIYFEKPLYVSNTIDSINFKFQNLKEGKYQLIAIKDEGANYFFDQNTDKIGFLNSHVNIPLDSFAEITLFKEITNFAWGTPKYVNTQLIEFPYYGNSSKKEILLKSKLSDDFNYVITKNRKKDTLNFWYSNTKKFDSLIFNLKILDSIKTVTIKPRETLIIDSLVIGSIQKTFMHLSDSIKIKTNLPITRINNDSIKIFDIDSLSIPFNIRINPNLDQAYIKIKPLPNDLYTINIESGAFIDFWGNSNKKTIFKLKTKAIEDYGIIFLNINSKKSIPYFIEVLNSNNEIVRKVKKDSSYQNYSFKLLNPGKYTIRVIKDLNNNNQWDTGNYLEKKQPEEVIYFPEELDLRANWELYETLSID
ncbi:MAG: Ig-like domain-containing protein [Flavobacteriaceae bacterium]|nr:Ig-like domain-containing protein [Flavobacteriaceae bacterium]